MGRTYSCTSLSPSLSISRVIGSDVFPCRLNLQAYCQSKLANVVYSYELDRRIANSGVTVNAVHPGVVATELGRYLFPSGGSEGQDLSFVERALAKLATLVLLSPARGAEASVYVASSEQAAGVSGKYFDSVSLQPKTSNKEAYDIERQDRLTALSKELVYTRS